MDTKWTQAKIAEQLTKNQSPVRRTLRNLPSSADADLLPFPLDAMVVRDPAHPIAIKRSHLSHCLPRPVSYGGKYNPIISTTCPRSSSISIAVDPFQSIMILKSMYKNGSRVNLFDPVDSHQGHCQNPRQSIISTTQSRKTPARFLASGSQHRLM